MSIGLFHGIWSILILAIFAGVVRWAWSEERREYFERAARMPFDEDNEA